MLHCRNQNGSVSLGQALRTMKRAAFVALFFITTSALAVEPPYVEYASFDWGDPPYLLPLQSCIYGGVQGVITGSQTSTCSASDPGPKQVGLTCKIFNEQGVAFITAWPVCRYIDVPPPPPPCAEGNVSTQYFNGSAPPSDYCDGACLHSMTGDGGCVEFVNLGERVCMASYVSTASQCSNETQTESSPQTCRIVNGQEICGALEPASTDNCVKIGETNYCESTIATGDCVNDSSGVEVCNSASPNDPTVTDATPKDPTTGNKLTPDVNTTTTDAATGNTKSSLGTYTPQTLYENDPYACDNPDTAKWEPCEGYCDNPSTVINECGEQQQSSNCGGFQQPPCDSSGNPLTVDPTQTGTTVTADGTRITSAIDSLENSIQGWNQPVIGQRGMFDQVGVSAEVTAAKNSYEQTLNQIRSDAAGSVHLATGAGHLPCWNNLTIPGLPGSYSMCPRNYEPQLSIVGTILIAIATLLAFIIIMR